MPIKSEDRKINESTNRSKNENNVIKSVAAGSYNVSLNLISMEPQSQKIPNDEELVAQKKPHHLQE